MARTMERNQKIQSLQIVCVCVCVRLHKLNVKTTKMPKKIYN